MRRNRHLVHLVVLATLALLAGCSRPAMEELHIPGGLTGFRFDPNATKARSVFPDRKPLTQYGWWAGVEDHNSVHVTLYQGKASPEQIEAARDLQAERYGRVGMEYGRMSAIIIDGRTAWGWLERQTYKGKLASLEYKAVVSYEDVCYAVEFHAGLPDYQDAAKLREVVSRFEVGRTKVNNAALFTGVAALVLGLLIFQAIGRAR